MPEAVVTFKALSDGTRLRILRALASSSFHVNELVSILGAGQSTVSRHLRLLSEAGLVQCRRTRTWAYYSLARDGKGFSSRVLSALDSEWEEARNPDQSAIDAVLARRRDATAAFFKHSANRWDRLRDEVLGPPAHHGRLLEMVGRAGTVVDLGTGTGVLLEELSPRAERVIGVDAAREMLDVAGRRTRDAKLPNVELRLGALEHLPLSDGEANAMVANLVLHHVAGLSSVLREIRRGLSHAGRVVIAELAETTDESIVRALGAQRPGFRADDLASELGDAGFRVLRTDLLAPVPANGHGPRPPIFLMEAIKA